MGELLFKLLGIRHYKVLLYSDNIYVGKIVQKFEGNRFIKSKKYGWYITPFSSLEYFIHGSEYRLNYNVDFIKALKPSYNKFDFFEKKNLNIKDLKTLKTELWDSLNKSMQLSPEYIEQVKQRVYTTSDIITFKFPTVTPLELQELMSGEDIKNIMKTDKPDYSWLALPMLAGFILIGIVIFFIGIPK